MVAFREQNNVVWVAYPTSSTTNINLKLKLFTDNFSLSRAIFFSLLAAYLWHELWILEICHWPPYTWSLNALARDMTVAAAVSGGTDESDLLPLHSFSPSFGTLDGDPGVTSLFL